MVFCFLIQSLNVKGYDVLYYRFYTSYENEKKPSSATSKVECGSQTNICKAVKIFETTAEKKDLLDLIAKKIHMHYYMKRQHALVPAQYDSKDSVMKGIFIERNWKRNSGNIIEIPIAWTGVPGLAFALMCKKTENLMQAHNILEVLMNQLEKHLQFISNPVMPLTLVETVSLVVNQFLPGGQLLFMNSKLLREFEKRLENDLFSK